MKFIYLFLETKSQDVDKSKNPIQNLFFKIFNFWKKVQKIHIEYKIWKLSYMYITP